jgi:hypothetical protein
MDGLGKKKETAKKKKNKSGECRRVRKETGQHNRQTGQQLRKQQFVCRVRDTITALEPHERHHTCPLNALRTGANMYKTGCEKLLAPNAAGRRLVGRRGKTHVLCRAAAALRVEQSPRRSRLIACTCGALAMPYVEEK